MKSPLLYFILLLLWMGGSAWYYVCKIKDHCEGVTITEITEEENDDVYPSQDFSADNQQNESTGEIEKSNEEIINDVKSKIEKGYTVYNFPKNSASNDKIEESFNEFAENLNIYLTENKTDKIEVIGHTDDVGSKEANMKFGMKRAQFIKNKLIKAGINKDRIIIGSKGKDEPVVSNETDEGREKNRRVVIKLIQN